MTTYQININETDWTVYRFPYKPVDSNMFFIPDGDTGIVVDPNENDDLLDVFAKHRTRKIVIVLTHEHYDHTCGVQWLQSRMESKLFCHEKCATSIASVRGNDPRLVAFVLSRQDMLDGGDRYKVFMATLKRYTLHTDTTFKEDYTLYVGNINLKCYTAPGHTPGSAIFIWGGRCLFTGDSLIQDSPTVLRLPESDHILYEEMTRPLLKSLDKDILVFPGHGEPFRKGDAKYL